MENLLISVINFAEPSVKGLAKLVYWFISISSSIALGVILFTVILKLITLPFDYFSKKSMRKNSVLMEQMRPELEKLQRQYANDKTLYNQKMMALYKKHGYSMWGSCLPTILTLVIFIVAISAFTNYSQFQNRQYFYEMSLSYNEQIYKGVTNGENDELVYVDDNKQLVVKYDKILQNENAINENETDGITVGKSEFDGCKKITIEKGYVKFEIDVKTDTNKPEGSPVFTVITEKAREEGATEGQEEEFVKNLCREASAETFKAENAKFLWVKNIFMPDSALEHPIYSEWSKFESSFGYSNTVEGQQQGTMTAEYYDELTFNLVEEKEAPNGYFILVILTAGISLLSQIIMTKSNKAQMELQTVDGQGAQSQKVMTIMMPIMMAVFAFMYTAAFSIYIIISSVIGIFTTLLINFITDKQLKKMMAEVKDKPIRGRVYVAKEEAKKEQPKKKEKKQKIEEHDFLSGLADKKKGKRK